MSRRAQSWALLGLCLAACVAPQGSAGPLGPALAELVARPELRGGRVGVVVVDPASGEVLAANDADRGFATASNMKLISSAVALTALGPEATAATTLLIDGEVRDGTLHGDVILRGHGDPTFNQESWPGTPLVTFAQALRQLGIRRVAGRVLGDGSWQGEEARGLGWQWDYLDEDYAAPFGGLNCGGNVVVVTVGPGQDGAPNVVARPRCGALEVAVEQSAAGTATKLVAHRRLGLPDVQVAGAIAADAREQRLFVTVADPARAAAVTFVEVLRAQGIEVDGEAAAGIAGPGARQVASHDSPSLAAILQPLLTNSDNLYAEQVWRWSARQCTGDGSTAGSERHAKAVLEQLGVEPAGMVLADGSGLSRRNLVKPRQLADLLGAMLRSPHRDAFVAGLPIGGHSGTLRKRFLDGPAHGHVHAKTGYISRVVCLSGYVERRDPAAPPLVFSVMLNDFTCSDDEAKAAIDAFVQRLAVLAGW
ncbi:MAG: D-alanyl-D-alanine carboxypeptidase/D-alanyl-D-alanine-endopeptidase [Planctomycetes bacterium]|nr:D-alanyl-D-alanine carboxypeptidase/D-alanyl-D-alanine-endopeptidase [Planctomycetota bacterium]